MLGGKRSAVCSSHLDALHTTKGYGLLSIIN